MEQILVGDPLKVLILILCTPIAIKNYNIKELIFLNIEKFRILKKKKLYMLQKTF